MKLEELKEEDKKEFLRVFNNDPIVRNILNKISILHNRRDYVYELIERKKLDELQQNTLDSYMEGISRISEKINLAEIPMPDETRQELNALFVTLFMACDIIDSSIRDYNDVLKKVDSTLQMEQFNDLKVLIGTTRKKIQFMNNYTKLGADFMWGDKCDEMYELMKNKARAILRKKSTKDWGKNMENFLAEHK